MLSPSHIPYTVDSFTVELFVIVMIVVRGTPLALDNAFIESLRDLANSTIRAYTASTNLIFVSPCTVYRQC